MVSIKVKSGKDVPNDVNGIIEISRSGRSGSSLSGQSDSGRFNRPFHGTSMRYPINYGTSPPPLPATAIRWTCWSWRRLSRWLRASGDPLPVRSAC